MSRRWHMLSNLLPAGGGGGAAMALFFAHSPRWPLFLLLGLVSGALAGLGLARWTEPAEPADSLSAAVRQGAWHGALAGFSGGLAGWLALCLWNGPGRWLGLGPLP